MLQNQFQAYETVNKTTMSGREIEAAVLTKAARKLKDCQDNWHTPDIKQKLDDALKYNQRIWSIFQAELTRDDSPLSADIKKNLLALSAFIDKRIFETMAYPRADKLTVVININNNIAAGLRGSPTSD